MKEDKAGDEWRRRKRIRQGKGKEELAPQPCPERERVSDIGRRAFLFFLSYHVTPSCSTMSLF
jgi:hypothetical protein